VLRINTLGRLYVERGERRLAGAAAQPRRLALLAVLAAAGSKGIARDRLLALLWPDTEEERARKGLNQAVYALRQELGSDDAIVGTRDLRLDPEVVRADVMDFRSALQRGDLEAAVQAYHGPFLDGFHLADAPDFERWIETERIGLARDHATALERLARRADEAGDPAAAADWWRKRASHDPLDAPTAVRLMEALVRAGDRTGALKHARIYEVLIAQELELPPDREVVALAERIRRDAEREPAPPAVTALAERAPVVAPVAPPVAPVLPPAPEWSGALAGAGASPAGATVVSAPAAPYVPQRVSAEPAMAAAASNGATTAPDAAVPSARPAVGDAALPSGDPPSHASVVVEVATAEAVGAAVAPPSGVVAAAAAPETATSAAPSETGRPRQLSPEPWRVTAPDLVAVPLPVPAEPRRAVEAEDPATVATPPRAQAPVVTPARPRPQIDESAIGYTQEMRAAGPIVAPRRWSVASAALASAAAATALTVAALQSWRPATDAPRLGTTQKATFEAGLEVDPALSPDGKVLAYAAGPEGAMRLYVRQLEGGRPVAVSGDLPGDHRRPRWSPDGTRLLFQANRGIWSVPSLGGAVRAVVEAPADPAVSVLYPTWSPDGASVAWVSRDTIYARALAGGAPRAVAALPGAHSPVWSPDGARLAAVAGNYAFVYGASAADVGYTSIGNRAPSAVWVLPADGRPGDGRAVRVTDAEHLNTSPEWLGDGRLLFVSDVHGSRDVYVLRLGRDGRPVGEPARLTTGSGAHSVSATADGRTVAYAAFAQRANIWALPIPTGAPQGTAAAVPVTSGTQVVEGLDVSPDGRWLVYDTDLGGDQDIWRVATDGSLRAEPVVDGPDADFMPAWSPDASTIAFYRFADGVRRVHLVPASGGSPRPILPGVPGDQHTPVWRPDGRAIAFHRFDGGRWQLLTTERADDGSWRTPRMLSEHAGWSSRWSPDGTRLAYLDYGQVRVIPANGDERGARVPFDARAAGGSLPSPVAVRWAADGRTLYVKGFDAAGQASLWAAPVDGGAPRLLVRFDEPLRPARRPEFATDGQRLFFTFAQSESDVWVVRVEER
jgi:Tol biopolymer transport system component/DNA-binding SARP family transcriptional activator